MAYGALVFEVTFYPKSVWCMVRCCVPYVKRVADLQFLTRRVQYRATPRASWGAPDTSWHQRPVPHLLTHACRDHHHVVQKALHV